jgi:hypothetical protein
MEALRADPLELDSSREAVTKVNTEDGLLHPQMFMPDRSETIRFALEHGVKHGCGIVFIPDNLGHGDRKVFFDDREAFEDWSADSFRSFMDGTWQTSRDAAAKLPTVKARGRVRIINPKE